MGGHVKRTQGPPKKASNEQSENNMPNKIKNKMVLNDYIIYTYESILIKMND